MIETFNDTVVALGLAISDEERCEIAKQSSAWLNSYLINYLELFYCQMGESSPASFYVMIVLLLVILFTAICLYSDRHFSLAMGNISQYLKLKPAVAGVTFLAFANGAPDFFTAFAGLEDTPELVIGSAIGSSLFVTTFVLGLVILNSKSKSLATGQVSELSSRFQSQSAGVDGAASTGNAHDNAASTGNSHDNAVQKEDFNRSNALDSRAESIDGDSSINVYVSRDSDNLRISHHFGYLKNSFFIILAISFLFSLLFQRVIEIWVPIVFLVLFALHLASTIYLQVEYAEPAIIIGSNTGSLSFNPQSLTSAHPSSMIYSVRSSEFLFKYKGLGRFLEQCVLYSEWDEKSILEKVLCVIRFPIDLVGLLSIPPMTGSEDLDLDQTYLPWVMYFYRIRLIVFPWFMGALIMLAFSLSTVLAWVLYALSSVSLSILFLFTSTWKRPPRYEPLIVLLGFSTCILWFYIISNELVAIMNTVGIVAHISPAILGIAVLAFGNTLGDLISNVFISRNGGFETALTACISGPIQNIFLSLGVAFLKGSLIGGPGQITLQRLEHPDLVFSFSYLLVVLTGLTITVISYGYCIPRNVGWILVILYVIGISISLHLGT